MKHVLALALTLTASSGLLAGAHAADKAEAKSAAPNILSSAEKAAGWRLLFDGKTSKGWHKMGQATFPDKAWVVEEGLLKRTAGAPRGGDIVTDDEFENFELKWEWRIASGGNSGLKYFVQEDRSKPTDSGVGFEYQMLDDEKHPDAKKGRDGNRTAASLYDLLPAAKDKPLHPPGEWNESRVLVTGKHVEHWLNGKKVLTFERGGPDFKGALAQSKFKDIAGFGDSAKGRLLIQDHGNEVAIRNLKLRPLSKK
jgi:hypothetical protein